MKRICFLLVVFLSVFFLFSTVFADDIKSFELAKATPDMNQEIATQDLNQEIAKSGCCSWHKGVCDCIGGRVVCCDGTFSPTCLCNHDNNREMIDSQK